MRVTGNVFHDYLLESGYSVMYGSKTLALEARALIYERLARCDAWASDAALIEAQAELGRELAHVPRQFVDLNRERFADLIGPDILVQKYPYLRIARPGKPQDNIGFHRDTLYGSSPYEVSLLIALTDMRGGAALKVLPGSHVKPADAYPYTDGAAQCEKGDERHALGFCYAPKLFSPEVREQMVPVEMRAGDMLIFFPSLIHGQEVNTSDEMRLSFDLRLCNSFAPMVRERSVHQDYYEPLCRSVSSLVAEAYGA